MKCFKLYLTITAFLLGTTSYAASSSIDCSIQKEGTGFRAVRTNLLGDNEENSLPTYHGFVLRCENLGGSQFLFLEADAQRAADIVSGGTSVKLELVTSGGGIEGREASHVVALQSSQGHASLLGYNISPEDGFTVIVSR
jgi:hypothetical protein